ncbi:uncharacterized protein UTRI_10538 [Ustilago trichophora]|uniref:Effector family protein Eff1 n=1 Tax=Ustilago trichophora TaxID=86804 RepID=A0A5C3ECT6_9BASI|nr:uncharacterized protein UTRI_10538 [Ustilago trichophora]
MLTLLIKVFLAPLLLGQFCASAFPMDPNWPQNNLPDPYGSWRSHSNKQPHQWSERFGIDAELYRQPEYQLRPDQYPASSFSAEPYPADPLSEVLYSSHQYPASPSLPVGQSQLAKPYEPDYASIYGWEAHEAGSSNPSQHYPVWQNVPALHSSVSHENVEATAGRNVGEQDPPANRKQPKDLRKEKSFLFRKQNGFPEPAELSNLPLIKDMLVTKQNGKLKIAKDPGNRDVYDFINTEVFNKHLQRLSPQDVPSFTALLGRKSPVSHSSRALPVPPVRAPPNTRANHVKLYMADHNLGNGPPHQFKGGEPFKPFYSFWGMPDISEARQNTVYFYGLGVLDKVHNEDVDALLQMKKAARQAIQGHPM